MGVRRSRLLAAVAVALSVAAPALATSAPAWNPHPFDANLSRDAAHEDGEPSIAVNPANPRNMIVIYLRNNDAFVPGAAKGQPGAVNTRDVQQQIQGCDYAVTFDSGRSWTRHPLPANDFSDDPTENNCSDSIVVFDRRGVAYVMASAFASVGFVGDSEYRLLRSTDGGRSWSKPAVVAPGMIGKGSHPTNYGGVRTYDDRPWLTIDPQTRDLFIDGTQVRIDGSGTGSVYLTGSTNGGRTWSDPIVVPAGPLGSAPLGAAFGTVGFAVKPPSGSSGCDCLDFLTSTDHARSLHRVHTDIPNAGGPQTVADPTRRGHFTVLVNTGTELRIYRTVDGGRTWSKPSRLTVQNTQVVKPWMNFSAAGVLGVGWRAARDDGSYAFFATVSTDGGAHFRGLQRLSGRWSPAAPPYYVAGDDTSSLTVSGDRLLAAWGDWRGPDLEDIYWGGFRLPR